MPFMCGIRPWSWIVSHVSVRNQTVWGGHGEVPVFVRHKPRSSTFWGDHYARLTRVEDRYGPGGLFFVHHGVGTET
jgi:hypothetical protein